MEEAWKVTDFHWDPRSLQSYPAQAAANGSLPQGWKDGPLQSGQGSQPSAPASGGGGTDVSSEGEQANGGARSKRKPGGAAGNPKAVRRRGSRAAPTCQVDGCGANLDQARPFYRLQRICESHARAAVVTDANGAALRFCQQCTRLHSVSDFEGSKRSCVASLQRRLQRKLRQHRQEAPAEAAGLAAAGAIGKRRTRGTNGGAKLTKLLAAGGNRSPCDSQATASCGEGGSGGSGLSGGNSKAVRARGAAGAQPATLLAALLHKGGEAAAGVGAGGEVPAGSGLASITAVSSSQLMPVGAGASLLEGPPTSLASRTHLGHTAGGAPPTAQQLEEWLSGTDLLSPSQYQALLAADVDLERQLAAQQAHLAAVVDLQQAQLAAAAERQQSAAQQPRQAAEGLPSLSPDEVDKLLLMDPDELAIALLARSEAGSITTSLGPLADLAAHSLPAALALPRTRVIPSRAFAPTTNASILNNLSTGGTASPGQLQRSLLGMVLASPQRSVHHPAEPPPLPAAAAQPLPLDGQPPAVCGLPPASWPLAQEVAAALELASAPVPQAAAALEAATAGDELEQMVSRFSLKVYGMRPDQLSEKLQEELQQALVLTPTVFSGAVRSGCTQLTLGVLMSGAEAAALAQPGGAAVCLARLLRCWQGLGAGGGEAPAGECGWRLPAGMPALRVLAQSETSSAAVLLQPVRGPPEAPGGGEAGRLADSGGALCAVGLGGSGPQERLQLSVLGPAAATLSAQRGRFTLRCPDWQQLLLGCAAEAQRTLHCRCRGRHVAVSLMPPGAHDGVGAGGGESDAEEGERAPAAAASPLSVVEQESEGWDALSSEAGSGSEGEDEGEDEGSLAAPPAGDKEADEEAAEAALLAALAAAECAEAWVPAAQRQWGLYEFELASGPLLGAATPLLLLPDEMEAAAAELQQLGAAAEQERLALAAQGASSPGPVQALLVRVLRLVGAVLEYQDELEQQAGGAVAAYPPAAVQRLAAAAHWLCALCVRCRWPALLRRLLPATTVGGGPAAAAVAAMDAALPPTGLLGAAAAAASAELLAVLADWAAATGHIWQLAASPGSGLTPLHLAAALGPGLSAEAAAALAAVAGPVAMAECWRGSLAGGWAPRQVAAAAGCQALIDALELSPAPAAAAPAASPTTPSAEATTRATQGSASASDPQAERAQQERLLRKLLQLGAAEEASGAGELDPLLLRCHLELDVRKKAGSDSESINGRVPRLPATAAELEAWAGRPLHPGLLAALGGAAIVIVLGLAAALRSGLYDEY